MKSDEAGGEGNITIELTGSQQMHRYMFHHIVAHCQTIKQN